MPQIRLDSSFTDRIKMGVIRTAIVKQQQKPIKSRQTLHIYQTTPRVKLLEVYCKSARPLERVQPGMWAYLRHTGNALALSRLDMKNLTQDAGYASREEFEAMVKKRHGRDLVSYVVVRW
jgi:hypothetical protein